MANVLASLIIVLAYSRAPVISSHVLFMIIFYGRELIAPIVIDCADFDRPVNLRVAPVPPYSLISGAGHNVFLFLC